MAAVAIKASHLTQWDIPLRRSKLRAVVPLTVLAYRVTFITSRTMKPSPHRELPRLALARRMPHEREVGGGEQPSCPEGKRPPAHIGAHRANRRPRFPVLDVMKAVNR